MTTSLTQKENRINTTIDFAIDKLKSSSHSEFCKFIQDIYRFVSPDEIINRPINNLYSVAYSLWSFSGQRDPRICKVRVFNPTMEEHGWTSDHTVIQIVNNDMPFLLDSITSNLLEDGIDLHMLVHPIIQIERDKNGDAVRDTVNRQKLSTVPESIMHIEITAMTNPVQITFLEAKIKNVLTLVAAAIEDWSTMLSKMDDVRNNLKSISKSDNQIKHSGEAINFLQWLKNDNFIILGYREYFHDQPKRTIEAEGFGLLREPDAHVFKDLNGLIPTSPEIEYFMTQPDVMLITKANIKSLVHRVVHLDYIGFKNFDEKGKVISEKRFVGLFTSKSYDQRAEKVPYLDRKINQVIIKSGFEAESHDGRALVHILGTLPRDELFQIEVEQLFETAMGILHLKVMPRCMAFIRKDRFERYVSALVYVPRDMYDSTLRRKIEKILCDSFHGELSSYYANLSNDNIARWHFIIRTKPGYVGNPETTTINNKLAKVALRWHDHLQETLNDYWGDEKGRNLFKKYNKAFSFSYQEHFSPEHTVIDINKLEQLPESQNIQFNFYRLSDDPIHSIRLKIYTSNQTIALSDCLPMLENLGLRVIQEYSFSISAEHKKDAINNTIHDFLMEDDSHTKVNLSDIKDRLEDTLRVIWNNQTDNDGFNKLVLRANMSYRQALILRIYSKYLRQLGMSFSEIYMQDTLIQYSDIAKDLTSLFEIKFNIIQSDNNKQSDITCLEKSISQHLTKVDSLDQDRMLRSFLSVISHSLRTNFYQSDEKGIEKQYVSIKIQTSAVSEAPKPRPFAEIFVYSPRIEGVHLRFGRVARGGLRWSDRREDYRTEVLGLVKAQQVKNTVIVPVGAKGGFVAKKLAHRSGRNETQKEAIACYKIFISGLLDITDNLQGKEVIHPHHVICLDGDDPYLVVAADKGTATFSDIANELAKDYNYWLADAFASGGSNGYDHKKMGITAKGAWISVQRHFREIGINVQQEPITIVGVGDMSGDVFGNGLLCSKAVKLVAAFDHRDIFIDPSPDPSISFSERQRLFDSANSSWQDYNQQLISTGGGIFSRTMKSIPLTEEIKSLLGFEDSQDTATPNQLLKAILKSKTDLLWFGGIGTYIKSSRENDADVGDRNNDAIRIDGKDINCKVIAEGGNLACTQRGRIEYCLKGGRINTDAVDNSAGVDCSDNEVNIKILLNSLLKKGKLSPVQRDKLLAEMTDEVSEIVLRDNYLQTQAITLAGESSIQKLDSFIRFMNDLVITANLDPELECLPSDEELATRIEGNLGLTRPEISILIAYSKMGLYDELMLSNILDDPYLIKYLIRAFPSQLQNQYIDEMSNHQLKKEIIAKELCNEIINRGGIQPIKEETGATASDIARATILTDDIFELTRLYHEVEKLDYSVNASVQTQMMMDLKAYARRQTIWFLNNTDSTNPLQTVIDQFKPGVEKLFKESSIIQDQYAERVDEKVARYQHQDIGNNLAIEISMMKYKIAACDIVMVAKEMELDEVDVARCYLLVGEKIGFDWLMTEVERVESADHWERMALNSLVFDLLEQQKTLTRLALKDHQNNGAITSANHWLVKVEYSTYRIQKLLTDFQTTGQMNTTKLGFAARQIRNVIIE